MSSLAQPLPFRNASLSQSRAARLAQLVLLPSFPAPIPARDRLERALGEHLSSFLIAALSEGQGRGASSP